jgi:hypothetical protein
VDYVFPLKYGTIFVGIFYSNGFCYKNGGAFVANRKEFRKNHSVKKKVAIIIASSVVLIAGALGIGYSQYRKSHFAYGATISGQKVSLMSVDDAYEKMAKLNQKTPVTITSQGETLKIDVPAKYQLKKTDVEKQLSVANGKLAENPNFDKELEAAVNSLDFKETAGKDAYLKFGTSGYEIVPEEKGTQIDKAKLIKAIKEGVSNEKGTTSFEASAFYLPVKVTADSTELKEKLKKSNEKIDKKIQLNINGNNYDIPREVLASFMDEQGNVNEDKVYAWVSGDLNNQFSTLLQTVQWKNPEDGKTYEYTNNGSYGWDINFPTAKDMIVKALNDSAPTANLTLNIDGDAKANPRDIKDYVYINLLEQKMYVYINNQKIVDTFVITGQNNKGTATVPGFHSIGYKVTDTTLKGTMMDGEKYAVPVKYFEPIISKGGIYTGIGLHDSPKTLFGDLTAWQTPQGSNGCINTPEAIMPQVWDNTYPGMAVIIQGDLYQNSPGEYDKPVELGTVIA